MYRSDYRKALITAIEKFQWPLSKWARESGHSPKKIETAQDLIDAIEHRASTERTLRPLFCSIASLLSPPACLKFHCEHYTAYSYCNCRLEREPYKCADHRAYKKRQKERREKQHCEIKETRARI